MKFRIARRFMLVAIFLILGIVTVILMVIRPWSGPLSAHDLLERVNVLSGIGTNTCRIHDVTKEIIGSSETIWNTKISYSYPDRIYYSSSTCTAPSPPRSGSAER